VLNACQACHSRKETRTGAAENGAGGMSGRSVGLLLIGIGVAIAALALLALGVGVLTLALCAVFIN
jgi:hypothetical protein